ncbi:MAG: chemotaxis protein CheW [Desulfuromonadales bacterium]|nr:chemotaxis protein CheW [Desulfuromonadales bacterium]NIS41353.1 chemotaxis protein CheW [Desulfuromonadales bacterium]
MFVSNQTRSTGYGPLDVSKTAIFRLKGDGYALPVQGVDHIVPTPRLYPLPLLDEIFLGVFIHDEDVVPLYNLYRFLGIEAEDFSDDSPFTILFMTEFGKIGLPADEVLRIVDNSSGTIEKVSEDYGSIADRCFVCSGTRYPLLSERTLLADLIG